MIHEKSDKYKNTEKNMKSFQSETKFFKPKNVKATLKEFDIKFSVSIACQTVIVVFDQLITLGEIIKDYGKDSDMENLKLHQTKCACLINNVISSSHYFHSLYLNSLIKTSINMGISKF